MKKVAVAALISSLALSVQANEIKEETVSESDELAKLSQKMNNPLADLWLLWGQHDITSLEDKSGKSYLTQKTSFQPVMSFHFNDDYNLAVRPNVQYFSADMPDATGLGRENGLGDTGLLLSLGTKEPIDGWILGAGVSILMPTASETYLSTGGADQFAAGPNFVGMKIGKEYTYGAVAQHFMGVGSSEAMDAHGDEEDINLTDIQYIWRKRLSPTLQIGFAPNITIDWNKSGSDKYTIPVGLGFDYMTTMGGTPVRVAMEGYKYVEQADEFGPEWGVRFFFIPVVQNPFK